MEQFVFLLFSFVLVNQILISTDADNGFFTPRGVPLSRAALYDPQKDFSCLDGSKMIPFSRVNDDYCDCEDSSDEPGTSACSKGQFFCLNIGHISGYIPTSRVGDSICDCCDGSDEDNIQCPNNCEEMGRAAREEAELQAKLAKEGFSKRIEMSKSGKETRKSKEEERSKLQAELDAAEKVKEARQQLKEEAEKPEKEALEAIRQKEEEEMKKKDEEEALITEGDAESLFKLIDSNDDGKIDLQEIKARQTFDKNKDGVVDDAEAHFFLNLEEEMSKEEFMKTGYYMVKPFFLLDRGMFTGPPADSVEHEEEPKETDQSQSEPPPQVEEKSKEQEQEDQRQDEEEEYDDEVEDHRAGHEESSTEETRDTEAEPAEEPASDKYDEATKALIDAANKARSEFEQAERTHRDISKKLQDLNDALTLDFGEDERFAPLHHQCFDYEDREYVYTFCAYKEASQRGKSGGQTINLGRWGSWTEKYSEMLLSNGQSCWNGPNRSARIKFQCGIENKVISVSEPSRCEYLFEFTTPALCINPDGSHPGHDEL